MHDTFIELDRRRLILYLLFFIFVYNSFYLFIFLLEFKLSISVTIILRMHGLFQFDKVDLCITGDSQSFDVPKTGIEVPLLSMNLSVQLTFIVGYHI